MRDGHKWRDRGTRNRSQARHYGARQKKCPTSSCEAVQRRSSTIFSRLRGSSQRRACWDQAMIFSCKVPPGQPAPPWRPLPKQRLHRVWRPPHTLVLSSRGCRCTWRAFRRWMLPSAATPVIRRHFRRARRGEPRLRDAGTTAGETPQKRIRAAGGRCLTHSRTVRIRWNGECMVAAATRGQYARTRQEALRTGRGSSEELLPALAYQGPAPHPWHRSHARRCGSGAVRRDGRRHS